MRRKLSTSCGYDEYSTISDTFVCLCLFIFVCSVTIRFGSVRSFMVKAKNNPMSNKLS